jgi:hypothetical protein
MWKKYYNFINKSEITFFKCLVAFLDSTKGIYISKNLPKESCLPKKEADILSYAALIHGYSLSRKDPKK